MNNFQVKFFKKYTPEWQKIKAIIHEHWLKIIKNLFLAFSLVFFVCFIYYSVWIVNENIPFWWLEIFLFILFIKIIYDILDWYNDVWIITNSWVVALTWALFNTKIETVNYENIEWVEVEQIWISDKMFNKWNLVLHKFWEDTLVLEDAMIPYEAIDEIEKLTLEHKHWEDLESDKFDLVMDTLSWVVKDYLWKNWLPSEQNFDKQDFEKTMQKEILQDVELKDWTIDLR